LSSFYTNDRHGSLQKLKPQRREFSLNLFKKFLTEQQGAVSLYLILILIPIFLLCALLIDFSRLKVAEKELENAVRTGVRSTLSAFSPALHDYGLYALDQGQDKSPRTCLEPFQGFISVTLISY
jgi:hypothetical protein